MTPAPVLATAVTPPHVHANAESPHAQTPAAAREARFDLVSDLRRTPLSLADRTNSLQARAFGACAADDRRFGHAILRCAMATRAETSGRCRENEGGPRRTRRGCQYRSQKDERCEDSDVDLRTMRDLPFERRRKARVSA